MNPTRRHVLSMGALAALGIPLRSPLARGAERLAGLLPAMAATPAPTGYEPVPPYSVTTSSTLSQDYFTTAEVLVDPGADTVVPVVRSDGSLAVLVLSQGALYLVHTDATAPGGYAVSELAPGPYSQVAAAAGPNATIHVCVYGAIGTRPESLGTATISADNALSGVQLASGAFGPLIGGITASTDQGGTVWFACTVAERDFGSASYQAVVIDARTGYGQTTSITRPALFHSSLVTDSAITASDVIMYGMIYGTSGAQWITGFPGGPDVEATAIVDPSGSQVDVSRVLAAPLLRPIPGRFDAPLAFLWTDSSGHAFAGAATSGGILTSAPVALLSAAQYGLKTGPVTQAEWFYDPVAGAITVYLLAGGTVWVQSLDLGATTPAGVPVPLQSGVEGFWVPWRGATSTSTLVLAVADPAVENKPVLQLLSRPSSTGRWIVTPLRMSAPTHLECSTYRTMVTVTDSAGVTVANKPISVEPDADMIGYDPQGALFLPGGVVTRLTTDTWGQVCLASPATSLTAVGFTVTDPALAQPAVAPDAELHGFLAGASGLNNYTTVNDALTAAAGTALPHVNASDTATIGAVSAAINAAMKAGAPNATSSSSQQFTLSGLDTATPTYSPTVPPTLLTSGWWDRVKHDVESAWHAVEHGVAKVSQVVSRWDNDAKAWAITLTISIEGYVDATIDYAVNDLRSACVAIHGIFQALGADIDSAISFLRTLVSDIAKDGAALAGVLYDWLSYGAPGTGLDKARTTIADAQKLADTAFHDLESDIRTVIGKLDSTVAGQTMAANRSRSTSPHQASVAGCMSDVKATWLLQKVRATAVSLPDPPADALSHLTNVGTTLADHTGYQQALSAAVAQFSSLSSPSDVVTTVRLEQVTALLLQIVSDGLVFVDDALDDLLALLTDCFDAFAEGMATPLDDLPLLADLFELLGIGKVTLGQLMCMIIGYPTAAVFDAIHAGRSWLPSGLTSARTLHNQRLGADEADWETVFDVMITITNIVSLIPLLIDDLQSEDNPTGNVPPSILTAANTIFGMLINVLTYPFATFGDPIHDWTPHGFKDGAPVVGKAVNVIVWMIGFLPPLIDWNTRNVTRPTPQTKVPLLDETIPSLDTMLGLLLTVGGAGAALAEAADPITLTLSLVSWLALIGKAFKYGGPSNELSWVSPVLDVANPPVIAVVEIVGVAL